jgi:hypothetical protein
MSDEFGTINVRRGERAREIEIIRQQYRRHRSALTDMIADAPTEHLAAEYQRLIGELDSSLMKLNELETPGSTAAAAAAAASASAEPPTLRDPGKRPLVTAPRNEYDTPVEEPGRGNKSLLFAILAAGLVVLGLLGWLMWRSASDERPDTPIVAETETTAIATPDDTGTITPVTPQAAVVEAFSLKPGTQDFGVIRKGTRAVRQFELTNTTDQPITVAIARSACRCLYYSHAPVIPPKAKETITVTIDGARAKAGQLQESVKVSSKADASIATTMNVTATVR